MATAANASSTGQKKRNNYKLLVDPEIKKGQKKIYRLNGKDEPGVSVQFLASPILVCSN